MPHLIIIQKIKKDIKAEMNPIPTPVDKKAH